MRSLVGLLAGLVFGAGLIVSRMTNADKVIDFLDLTDAWDPTLAFVMLGGIAFFAPVYALVTRRSRPILDDRFHVPTRRDVTLRLVAGSGLFGVGWALGGYCPGPALTTVATGAGNPVAVVAGMVAGVLIVHAFEVVAARQPRPSPSTK